jgi:hypothetical protein
MPLKKKRLSRRPSKAMKKKAPAPRDPKAGVKARLETVALYQAQRRVRDQVEKDRDQKFKDFLAQTEKPAEPAGPEFALRAIAAVPGKQNLRILAEGDSWFEYPLPVTHGDGVIYQLEKLLGYPIANMAHHGLEVEQMMGLSLRQEIIARLSDQRVRFDALLFSGGGNDIVGDQFCIWLKDSPPVVPAPQMLDLKAVNSALAILEAEFRELVDIRDQYSADTVIFVHAYDFPPITGKGVCGEGPWLKPSLDYAYKHLGVANPNPNDEFVVVKTLLEMFGAMLQRVAADSVRKNFIVVPTQGTLNANASDWQNEIHPSSTGFVKIAEKFQASLGTVFP